MTNKINIIEQIIKCNKSFFKKIDKCIKEKAERNIWYQIMQQI